MRVVLFGSGAMGCLFGARLVGFADVAIVDTWAEGVVAIRQRGVILEDSGATRSVPVRAQLLHEPAVEADLAIVLVKAWQTSRIASRLERYLSRDGLAVSLQNGLGNVEMLGPRAYAGSTTEGATLLGPGHVRAAGSGITHLAAPAWAVDLLRQAGFDSRPCSPQEAEGLLWGKLCASCGINAPTAILRVENGELLERPDASDLMVRAAEECAAVARAKNIRIPFSDPAVWVREVARRTARNRSSMYQDLLRGAPTECDAIYGAVVREAGILGVAVPVNTILWKLMRALAAKSRSEIR
ncbi:MAG: ketopantoate reductase family protein [Acidobacteria bacterium]|nr:ketopantoate reductase family protein [Acidobacteriota bacterium]